MAQNKNGSNQIGMDSISGAAKMAPAEQGRIKLSVDGVSRMNPVNAAPVKQTAPATDQNSVGKKK